MDWVILAVALVGTSAAIYNAYNTYVSNSRAAVSARIAKHAAKEAGAERNVASKAARIAVAASGTDDPGTALDPERVSGVPEEIRERVTKQPYQGMAEAAYRALFPDSQQEGAQVVYGTAARAAFDQPPTPASDVPPLPDWATSRPPMSVTRPRALTRQGRVVGFETTTPEGRTEFHGRPGEVPQALRPDGTYWDYVDGLVPPRPGLEATVAEWPLTQDPTDPTWRPLWEQHPEPVDPSNSDAPSPSTASAPEDQSLSGGLTSDLTAPSLGDGGGDTSSDLSSGRPTPGETSWTEPSEAAPSSPPMPESSDQSRGHDH